MNYILNINNRLLALLDKEKTQEDWYTIGELEVEYSRIAAEHEEYTYEEAAKELATVLFKGAKYIQEYTAAHSSYTVERCIYECLKLLTTKRIRLHYKDNIID